MGDHKAVTIGEALFGEKPLSKQMLAPGTSCSRRLPAPVVNVNPRPAPRPAARCADCLADQPGLPKDQVTSWWAAAWLAPPTDLYLRPLAAACRRTGTASAPPPELPAPTGAPPPVR